tara:strand:- start:826 stop:1188 length:363 start_codon:yes stop_codon:yes gene_type:complete
MAKKKTAKKAVKKTAKKAVKKKVARKGKAGKKKVAVVKADPKKEVTLGSALRLKLWTGSRRVPCIYHVKGFSDEFGRDWTKASSGEMWVVVSTRLRGPDGKVGEVFRRMPVTTARDFLVR